MANTGELVSRIYSNFRGVDFRGEEINLVRSPDSLNVWKDYKYTESIRTRPGLKLYMEKHKYDGSVYGVRDPLNPCDKYSLPKNEEAHARHFHLPRPSVV